MMRFVNRFAVCALILAVFPAGASGFALKPGSFKISSSTLKAGAHEDLTTAFKLVHNGEGATNGNLKTTIIELPAGFNGSDTAVPACTSEQLIGRTEGGSSQGAACPTDTQVGTISFSIAIFANLPYAVPVTVPLYNMQVSNPGIVAMFGFNFNGIVVQNLPVRVRPSDLGLTVTSEQIQGTGEVSEVSATVWGVPASPVHDEWRGRSCDNGVCKGGGESVNIPVKPFLSTPTYCPSEPLAATLKLNDWQEETNFLSEQAEIQPMIECERVPFHPSIEVHPATHAAETATGLNVSVVVPQSWENANTLATSNLKDSVVTLPEGMTVNPSAGSGLGACSPEQYAAERADSLVGEGCPQESKIGSIEIETPVLPEKIPGAIYIATPYDNVPAFGDAQHPGGSLLALYVVAKDPQDGILIKVAGKIEPDPVTGRLVTRFLDTPQQPFSKFTLKFRPGATAPLVSPPACGSYATTAAFTPWSAPDEPRLVSSEPFEVTQGVREGACPSGGIPPFSPQTTSGTLNNVAGNYSSFYLRIRREDGEQELTKFTTVLPPGLTANLSGIPFCSDAQIQHAREATGREELAHPSCPAASEIGHTLVGAGVGTVLAWTPGKVYLAGPYNGSALSIVSVTSATVGPFDLGTVVIRFALKINPITGQAEIDGAGSDPIPHIIDGIVVHVRDIHVYIDRPRFTINPTSCEHLTITNAITGAGVNPASSSDDQTVAATAPFQAADCSSLAFKPSFKATTSGKTSRSQGASLSVKLTYPKAPFGTQANIRSVHVELPKALPSRLSTLNHACLDSAFNQNPASCPSQSRVGFAKAVTPVLPVPLEGPAYFVSHGGQKFPELIVILQGYGVTVDLQGETFISKAGITSSTFKSVPDVPVGSFELTLPEGPFSALAANRDLCTTGLTMPTTFHAQNGAVLSQKTAIEVQGCPYALRIAGRHVHKRTLKLKISVPGAGRLVASGKGVSKAAKSAKGRQTLTLTLKESKTGKLRTRIMLRFTPAGPVGKQRGKKAKILRKSLTVTFR